ncbi:hypothetical protein [Rhodococcus opacus]|uniref:hypothetical protein n=1 Tax=Rhodococcus opacus TaxID=37919 RepID=UPI001C4482C0|nr:hypothetical protein [Rhodococcus opacus]
MRDDGRRQIRCHHFTHDQPSLELFETMFDGTDRPQSRHQSNPVGLRSMTVDAIHRWLSPFWQNWADVARTAAPGSRRVVAPREASHAE